jgi:hypothetical protein
MFVTQSARSSRGAWTSAAVFALTDAWINRSWTRSSFNCRNGGEPGLRFWRVL